MAIVQLEGLGKLENNSNDLIGNRTANFQSPLHALPNRNCVLNVAEMIRGESKNV
jgi:hypothetical protein